MKSIKIYLSGEHSCGSVFNVLNESLKFPYGHPDWDSMSDAISVLEWLDAGVDVEIFIAKDFSLDENGEFDRMITAFASAYTHNKSRSYPSRLMLHLE